MSERDAVAAAAVDSVLGGTGLRDAARRFGLPPSTLCRMVGKKKKRLTVKPNGRPPRLTVSEEKTLLDSVAEFSALGTPLNREQLKALARLLIESLPIQRQKQIAFKNNTPGKDWVRNFINRNGLSAKTKQALDSARYDAMTVENFAAHYARLKAIYEKYRITCPSQIFNLDETGFSMQGAVRGKTKLVTLKDQRANCVSLKISGSIDHVTVMPVVSADGKVWNPAVVLKGKRHRVRKSRDGSARTLHNYFPPGSYIYMRENVASMDSEIFALWATEFVAETEALRRRKGALLLLLDGMDAHLKYSALKTLKDAGIVVIALPAHTSHALQPLDLSVFAATKEKFRELLSERTISTRRDLANDIFVIAEMITKSYDHSLSMANIKSGFASAGIWPLDEERVLRRHVLCRSTGNEISIHGCATSVQDSSGALVRQEYLNRHKDLVNTFRRRVGALEADGLVPGTNYVTTKSGATMTSDNILEALRVQDESKKEKDSAKTAAELRKERKQIYPETPAEVAHLLAIAEARKRRRESARWRQCSRARRQSRS